MQRTKEHEKLMRSADITIIIRKDVPSYSMAIFDGVQWFQTALILRQDFLFGKYNLAHALGHMIGCGHEEGGGKK